MRTRRSKGRNGVVYPLIGGGHGLCVKRDPLYITADSITQWWLESNNLTSYRCIAQYIAQTPLSKTGLLRDLKRYYTVDDVNIQSKGYYTMALTLIQDALGFPEDEEE